MDKVTKLFDCHSHWGTKRGYLFRTEAELAQQEKIWKTKATFWSEDEMADYFRQNNVRTILDLSFTKFLPIEEIRAHHDYAFEFQRKHPDVVFGHWLQFDPRRALEAIREFDRALGADAGFVGLCVNGQVLGIPPSDPSWDPLYQLAIEAGRPIMILTGLTGIGQGLPGGKGIVLDHAHPRHIDAVAARFPQLRILAARPAYPWQDDMLAVLAHKPNVSYELHGWGPRQYSPALKKAIAGRLADRVMFGCDFPVLRYEKVMADWNAEGYSREVLEKVLYRNAETYFGARPGWKQMTSRIWIALRAPLLARGLAARARRTAVSLASDRTGGAVPGRGRRRRQPPAWWRRSRATAWDSRWSSRIKAGRPARSAPNMSRARRPMDTRCCWRPAPPMRCCRPIAPIFPTTP